MYLPDECEDGPCDWFGHESLLLPAPTPCACSFVAEDCCLGVFLGAE